MDLLIGAVKELSGDHHDFVLVIAGEGSKAYEGKLRDMVRDSGLSGRTVFAGFVNGAEKRALLADSDVFVLPSYQENFGMAIVEAMAAGLPVIVSHQVNIHHEISDAGAGLVSRLNSAGLVLALRQLLDDDSFRRQMGEKARNLVEQRFRWRQIAPRMVALYKSMVGSRPDVPIPNPTPRTLL